MDVVPSWTKTHENDEIGGTYAVEANMPNVPMRHRWHGPRPRTGRVMVLFDQRNIIGNLCSMNHSHPKRTFLSFSMAAFSFFSHFLADRCICFDVIRRLTSSSSSDTLFPIFLGARRDDRDLFVRSLLSDTRVCKAPALVRAFPWISLLIFVLIDDDKHRRLTNH